eukprot:scaffold9978_cov117-Skeletonema_menzelii.AAC.3
MLRKRSVQKAWREDNIHQRRMYKSSSQEGRGVCIGHGAGKAQTIQQRRMRTKQARKGGVCYVHSAKARNGGVCVRQEQRATYAAKPIYGCTNQLHSHLLPAIQCHFFSVAYLGIDERRQDGQTRH